MSRVQTPPRQGGTTSAMTTADSLTPSPGPTSRASTTSSACGGSSMRCPTGLSSRLSRSGAARAATTIQFEAMWRALVAGMVFQHPSIEALLRELNRNPALLDACGFHPVPLTGKRTLRAGSADRGDPRHPSCKARSSIPSSHNVSRFVAVPAQGRRGRGAAVADGHRSASPT